MTLYFSLSASEFPCVCCADLEVQLEVLTSFIAIGNVLESAYLLDEDGLRLDLPVEAFDGLPLADGLLKLTREYQALLAT